MTEKRAVTYVELDVDYCQLSHGTSPCTATGTPCFNTLSTCQDRQNFCGLPYETASTDYANGTKAIFESYYAGDYPEDLTYRYNEPNAWIVTAENSPSDLIFVHDGVSTDGNGGVCVATWNGLNADNVTVKALVAAQISGTTRGKNGVVAHVSGDATFTGYAAIVEKVSGSRYVSLYRAVAYNPDTGISYSAIGATLTRLGTVAVSGTEGTWRWIKLNFANGVLSVRTWLYGTSEPSTWDISVTDSSPLDPGATGIISAWSQSDNLAQFGDFYAQTAGERVTLRWTLDTLGLPSGIDAIPSLKSVSYTPATLSLGQDLGERASVSAEFIDHPWNDIGPGYDPYTDQRDYDPYTQGSYWGKFRARQLYIQGRPFRLIRSTTDQAYADMTVYHFLADKFTGPDAQSGAFQITAKDVLKFVDAERAKAPILSEGYLLVALNNSITTLYLQMDACKYYPETGYIAIGGTEICSYTNNYDGSFTIVRGELNTDPVEHNAEERIQWILPYVGQDAADIIYDLLVNYGGIDASYIDLTAWQAETAAYLGNVYSAYIAEPTSIKELIAELIEEAALAVWWEPTDQKIKLRVLRGIDTTSRAFSEDVILDKSLQVEEQPDTRLTQVWVYFGRRNPLKSLDEVDNYQSAFAEVDLQVESDHGVSSIKTIFSRWIAIGGRSAAQRIAQIFISRFKVPPRKFTFSLWNNETPVLGEGYNIANWTIQDETGASETAPIQITRITPFGDHFEVEAQEQLFDYTTLAAGDDRTIIINSSTANINLKNIHDAIYPAIEQEGSPTYESPSITVTCIIETGVYVFSTSTANPAFDVGDWPSDTTVIIILRGKIVGAGGKGGDSSPNVRTGGDGGTALYVRRPIRLEIDDVSGGVWGGGGGGVGGEIRIDGKLAGGAGGGAGMVAGDGGTGTSGNGEPGTLQYGGAGNPNHTSDACPGTDGGDLGQDGEPAYCGWNYAAPGSAGLAIDGISYVDKIGTGDIRGDEVN